jgi:hypothetical protein
MLNYEALCENAAYSCSLRLNLKSKAKDQPLKTKDQLSILFCNLAACKAFAILFST